MKKHVLKGLLWNALPRTLLMSDANEQIAKKCSKMGGGRVERKKLWAGKKVNELQSRDW